MQRERAVGCLSGPLDAVPMICLLAAYDAVMLLRGKLKHFPVVETF